MKDRLNSSKSETYGIIMRKILLLFFLLNLVIFKLSASQGFDLIKQNKGASLYYGGNELLVQTAIDLVVEDSKLVCNNPIIQVQELKLGSIIVGSLHEPAIEKIINQYQVDVSEIKNQWEAFQIQIIQVDKQSVLLILGSDAHGVAYGVLELSRKMGISPWVWWADATPQRKSTVTLPMHYKDVQKPAVQFRGIFLNDEDWGLTPWSSKTYEPEAEIENGIDLSKTKKMQTIGPKTYARIFELLLRLRANTIWPAMHEVTVPFYFVKSNRQTAEKYGIYIGSSHCEPMARNSATEWDIVGEGSYNYVNNKKQVLSYWSDRLKELSGKNNIFTLGMRGKHDGAMEGAKTTAEYREAIDEVIVDQTSLLKRYINPDPTQIPQVVIPYKEVLDVYRAGMKVPDYATLMWCDDNYGYITHFPDAQEKSRSGGNGIYYHVSYWGRPHDYLWLSTMNPALIYQQMSLAYQEDIRKIWIVNVGDIKPAEYQIELFLDMAWNMERINTIGVHQHLSTFLEREFGHKIGRQLLPLIKEHYRLAHIRKPEFMGNTRTEEKDPKYKIVQDLPWSEKEIKQRLLAYKILEEKVSKVMKTVPSDKKDTYFQLVAYPVLGAASMNEKHLNGQLARHGKADWEQSHRAFDKIIELTEQYAQLNGGKWNRMMDYKPRNLAVFDRLSEEKARIPMIKDTKPFKVISGRNLIGARWHEGLGYTGEAAAISVGEEATYQIRGLKADSVIVAVHLLPSHAMSSDDLRFEISLDRQSVSPISYKTVGRSEEWKENVLRNQAIRKVKFSVTELKNATLRIKALDKGVVVDQVMVYLN